MNLSYIFILHFSVLVGDRFVFHVQILNYGCLYNRVSEFSVLQWAHNHEWLHTFVTLIKILEILLHHSEPHY